MTVVEVGARPEGGVDGAVPGMETAPGREAALEMVAAPGREAAPEMVAVPGREAAPGMEGVSEREPAFSKSHALARVLAVGYFPRISGRAMAGRERDATRLARFSAHLDRERENERNQRGPIYIVSFFQLQLPPTWSRKNKCIY